MTRAASVLLAIAGLIILGSIPFAIAAHLQRVAAGPPRDVANGKVVAIEPQRESYKAVVEFSSRSGTTVRFRSDPGGAKGPSGLSARRAMKIGDAVLVAYDPANPEATAEVTSIRPLWIRIVIRGVAGSVCFLVGVMLFISTFRRGGEAR